jgi:hypothetical protein
MKYRKGLLSLLLALCLALSLAAPALAETAEKPEPDRDLTPLPEEWFDDTLFIGDSITYVLMQYCDSQEKLPGMQIWSEQSLNVYTMSQNTFRFWYRGEAYSLPELVKASGAKRVIFCLGINDIVREGGVEQTMALWPQIFDAIKELNPDAELMLQSCFPMWKVSVVYDLSNDVINEYNAEMRDFCAENGHTFVDIADAFRTKDGSLKEEYSSDSYVHLTPEAAELWVEQLRNPANYSVDPRSL